jgi:glycosyltransferase involved in cell wall biosynthesis
MTLPPAQAARWRGARFAHLIESDGPGGAERMLASVAAELQSAGSDNLVLVPAGGEGWLARELSGTRVQVETYRLDRPFSPRFAKWLAARFREHRIMLAHSHEFSMAVYGTWAARLAGGTAHLFTMHGTRYYAERLRRRIALRAACQFSSAAVCVSQQLARLLARDLWIRPSRVVSIPNGVRPPPRGATQSSLRDELGLASTDRLVVAVGNLYPVKGHRYLLEALAHLGPRHPELHVAIAGRGELDAPLRARARELQVDGRFHLLGLRSDIPNVLASADVFVLPSLSEGLPLALLEAMLAGRPVVATSVGEVPIVLDGGRAGLLVHPEDAPGLATAVSSLLSDPALARRVSAAALKRATERYTLDAMMEGYLALYAKALRNHSDDARPERVREDERQPLPHSGPPGERALMG